MISRPAAAADVTVEDFDDEVCLYRSDRDEVLVLNGTAGDIWRLSDGELTVDELTERLAAVYGQRPDSIRADVDTAIADLATRGYLREATSTGAPPATVHPADGAS